MISIDNEKCTLTYLLTTSVTDRQTNGRQTVLYISDIKFLETIQFNKCLLQCSFIRDYIALRVR